MKDEKDETRPAEHPRPKGEARWSDRPKLMVVPGRPEFALFPDRLTWHYGNSEVERPYVASVTYSPWLPGLRQEPETGAYEMDYWSVHAPECWITFKAAADGSLWIAQRFIRGQGTGGVSGDPGLEFFRYLALLPITDEENPFARDWDLADILSTRADLLLAPDAGEEAPRDPKTPNIPALCAQLLGLAQNSLEISRADAAIRLIGILESELAGAPRGTSMN